jgi:hypothetical protein
MTIIILGEVGQADRRLIERIEGNEYEDHKDFMSKVSFHESLDLYKITDFMDGVNNQEIEDFSSRWIGYVYFKK